MNTWSYSFILISASVTDLLWSDLLTSVLNSFQGDLPAVTLYSNIASQCFMHMVCGYGCLTWPLTPTPPPCCCFFTVKKKFLHSEKTPIFFPPLHLSFSSQGWCVTETDHIHVVWLWLCAPLEGLQLYLVLCKSASEKRHAVVELLYSSPGGMLIPPLLWLHPKNA